MSHTSDIHELLGKVTQTMLAQVQQAAAADTHHYEVLDIKQMQVEFSHRENNYVTYKGVISLAPKTMATNDTLKYFLFNALKKLNMVLDEFYFREQRNDIMEFNFEFKGKFTPNQADTTDDGRIVVDYDALEEMTEFKFAVYEGADLPENIIIKSAPYHLVDYDDDNKTATYETGMKLYE